ncbi:MAG: hypothetical protein MZU95_10990 [Desulfomicrobium escambiense]|nr:hypothetical protein [Desulfomicrobium escambiense]
MRIGYPLQHRFSTRIAAGFRGWVARAIRRPDPRFRLPTWQAACTPAPLIRYDLHDSGGGPGPDRLRRDIRRAAALSARSSVRSKRTTGRNSPNDRPCDQALHRLLGRAAPGRGDAGLSGPSPPAAAVGDRPRPGGGMRCRASSGRSATPGRTSNRSDSRPT